MDLFEQIRKNDGFIHPYELIETLQWGNEYKTRYKMPSLDELKGRDLSPIQKKMKTYLQCDELSEFWLDYGSRILYCTDDYLKRHGILLTQNQGENSPRLLGQVEVEDEHGESTILHVLHINSTQ